MEARALRKAERRRGRADDRKVVKVEYKATIEALADGYWDKFHPFLLFPKRMMMQKAEKVTKGTKKTYEATIYFDDKDGSWVLREEKLVHVK